MAARPALVTGNHVVGECSTSSNAKQGRGDSTGAQAVGVLSCRGGWLVDRGSSGDTPSDSGVPLFVVVVVVVVGIRGVRPTGGLAVRCAGRGGETSCRRSGRACNVVVPLQDAARFAVCRPGVADGRAAVVRGILWRRLIDDFHHVADEVGYKHACAATVGAYSACRHATLSGVLVFGEVAWGVGVSGVGIGPECKLVGVIGRGRRRSAERNA